MRRRRTAALACCVFLACSEDPTVVTGSDGGSDASSLEELRDAACKDFAARFCAGISQCSPASFSSAYPDLQVCAERNAVKCRGIHFAPGNDLAAVADPRPCLEAYDFSTCESTLRIISETKPFPLACPSGTGKTGSPCWYSHSCEGDVCFNQSFSTCGNCGQLLAPGKPCSAGTCTYGYYCDDTCKKLGELGDACAGSSQCAADLACVGSKCAPRLPAGSACEGDDRDPCGKGTACNPKGNTCVTLSLALLGEPCGFIDAMTAKYCMPDSACKDGFTAAGPGVCTPRKKDGEACKPFEDACVAPAICFEDKCRILAGNVCGYPPP